METHAPLPFDLDVVERAHGYQKWVVETLAPFLGQRILEVGAGSGNFSRLFAKHCERLVLAEPDARLRERLASLAPAWTGASVGLEASGLPLNPAALAGEAFDTVVTLNVLEHIEDDQSAFASMAELMRQSGAPGPRRLISFVPAHPFSFGTLDVAEGHYRRYDRARLRSLAANCAPEASHRLFSFNFVGLWGWWLNGVILKRPSIDPSAVGTFEKILPLVKPLDSVLLGGLRLPLGQSLISVLEWPARKP